VTFNEKTLREMIASPYGESCGRAFVDRVESGHTLTIIMDDGRSVVLEKAAEAHLVLRELFRWKQRKVRNRERDSASRAPRY
jgi:hypothetical protein